MKFGNIYVKIAGIDKKDITSSPELFILAMLMSL